MCVRRVVRESAVNAHSLQCAGCAAQQDEGNANCFFIVCTEGRGSNYHSTFVFTLPLFILDSFSLSVTHTRMQTHKCTQSPLCKLLNIFEVNLDISTPECLPSSFSYSPDGPEDISSTVKCQTENPLSDAQMLVLFQTRDWSPPSEFFFQLFFEALT